MIYEIRKGGQSFCRSQVKNCGYSDAVLKNMKKLGYSLYADGKCVMRGAQLRLRVGR